MQTAGTTERMLNISDFIDEYIEKNYKILKDFIIKEDTEVCIPGLNPRYINPEHYVSVDYDHFKNYLISYLENFLDIDIIYSEEYIEEIVSNEMSISKMYLKYISDNDVRDWYLRNF